MDKRQNNAEKRRKFERIIKKIRRNPQKGLEIFYETYKRIIHATAKTVCRSAEKTNEVVNEVLVKVWKNAENCENVSSPEGWVYVVTLNTAKDKMKERYLLPLDENIATNSVKEEDIFSKDSFYWMISDLTEKEQEIMILKFVSKYTFQEIADEINAPLATVTARYYRALEKIEEKIKNNT